ncbi:sugar ABC transporter ATP-binding protein [Kineococcus aurantiacus]|uniref:ABC-type sugar transport system ATPase subunit n=1 Tax=Kineococcus aurantiacus TaxID=37633 RepID=A0A7Y9J313_9ACTN|nr:sugar ABC transporter ATP-binding protein [Kineococcus aurantiacus]NYD24816.1 ABC-type sugar transport system ATPase subunit [Kineococcus aurantiacus]
MPGPHPPGPQPPGAPRNPSLAISGLTKKFGASTVLDGVDLVVGRGRVHALIGQNGAGKSTLVKTLAGLYPDYSGDIQVDGRDVTMRNPRQARRDGVAVIHQEFSLVSTLTVAENLLLGREGAGWRYDGARLVEDAADLVRRVGITLGAELTAPTEGLSPAVHQRMEIVKALAENAKVLVMDEPTARLSEAERVALFDLVRDLAAREVGIVFISHYLDEVREICDEVTVMRNGTVVATQPARSSTVSELATLMLGEELAHDLQTDHRPVPDAEGEAVMTGHGLTVPGRLHGIDVTLHRGEVLGVAGLVGSGRTRLCRVLAGADRPTSGTLTFQGRELRLRSPRAAIRRGIALIPEDRKHQALSMEASLSQNLVLMAIQRGLGRWGLVSRRSVRRVSSRVLTDLEVRPHDVDAPAGTLSGGNQQKVVLGKALLAAPDVLIVDQPTAGVDVGTKAQIHRLIKERARAGAAVLVVSDDLEELYGLGDRFQVLHRGRTTWTGYAQDVTYDELVHSIASGEAPRAT